MLPTRFCRWMGKGSVLVVCIRVCWVIARPFSVHCPIGPKDTVQCHGIPWPIAPLSAICLHIVVPQRTSSKQREYSSNFQDNIILPCIKAEGVLGARPHLSLSLSLSPSFLLSLSLSLSFSLSLSLSSNESTRNTSAKLQLVTSKTDSRKVSSTNSLSLWVGRPHQKGLLPCPPRVPDDMVPAFPVPWQDMVGNVPW